MAGESKAPGSPVSIERKAEGDNNYWTPERMREARPMELPHPDEAAGEQPSCPEAAGGEERSSSECARSSKTEEAEEGG